MAYKIVRHFFNLRHSDERLRTLMTGLTLKQAQAHCNDPETSSTTATSAKAKRYTEKHGPWFDGYTEMK